MIHFKYFLIFIFLSGFIRQTTADTLEVNLLADGTIPLWLTAGPFEQPIVLFQGIADADSIGEMSVEAREGKPEKGAMNAAGRTEWRIQSADTNGYVDFNTTIGWDPPGAIPEKIRDARAAYACTYLHSTKKQRIRLLTGSNARLKVWLNNTPVYNLETDRPARADQDTILLTLEKGRNKLLLKVGNSYKNYYMPFWGGIDWGWGFYARLLKEKKADDPQLTITLPVADRATEFSLKSSIFFMETEAGLQQELNLVIHNRKKDVCQATFSIEMNNKNYRFAFTNLGFGENRRTILLPALESTTTAVCALNLANELYKREIVLKQQPRYELHLMLLSHMDIGYTHPQPVGEERHLATLDEVVRSCENDSSFRWTIETVRLVEAYEQYRTKEQFDRLMFWIAKGHIALSPLYSNPFTGWIDEGELMQSFRLARDYKKKYGMDFSGAIYNDTPGLNWSLPQALEQFDTRLLVCGINEIYGGYRIQKNLPKVFGWKGSDGAVLPVYICEAYTEGRTYGFENPEAVKNRIWYRLEKLRASGYDYELILLDAAMTDNAGIPWDQYKNAQHWNKQYAYPKVITSTLNTFTEAFLKRYKDDYPVIAGDWTSDWDILSQGEPARMIKHRQTQNKLINASKLAGLSHSRYDDGGLLQTHINEAYAELLRFSGHGSGLEFGFGSPEANAITMAFREQYVHGAWLKAEDVLLRALYRLTEPQVAIEHEGVIVFNTLNWERDVPIEVTFPEQNETHYRVVDARTDKTMPSYRDGYKLHFIASGLPPLGYRKFLFYPDTSRLEETDIVLRKDPTFIENAYYRIRFDPVGREVLSVFDKKRNQPVLETSPERPLNQLIVKKLFEDKFTICGKDWEKLEVIDQSPVRLLLSLSKKDDLLERMEWILWEGLNRVDVTGRINLEVLSPPEQAEEYAMVFPFTGEQQSAGVEVLGGFLNPEKDRFPIVTHHAFSIRRSVMLEMKDHQVHIPAKQV